MKRILLTCGTESFTQRVSSAFKQADPEISLFFASSEEFPEVLKNTGKYFSLPAVDSDVFVHELLKLCLYLEIDYLIPLDSREVENLNKQRILFEEYGMEVFIPHSLKDVEALINPPKGIPLLFYKEGKPVFILDGNQKGREMHESFQGILSFNDEEEVFVCLAR